MDLKEAISNIKSKSVVSEIGGLPSYEAEDNIPDFFNKFILPKLPRPEVVMKWHRALMEYTNPSNFDKISCMVRYGNRGDKSPSKKGETGYKKLRRGWLTRNATDGFEYFFADNYAASFIYKMALDWRAPDSWHDLLDIFSKHEFPYGFNFHHDKKYEALGVTIPTHNEPGFLGSYKISHVFNVGTDYMVCGKLFKTIKELSEKYFDIGHSDDWLNSPNCIRKCKIDDISKQVIVASFLRFADPINYFLTPSPKRQKCASWMNCNDIGEYPPLIAYMKDYMKNQYGSMYPEFLDRIMLPKPSSNTTINNKIEIEYGTNVGSKKSSSPLDEQTKLELSYKFLKDGLSLIKLEETVLNLQNRRGWAAKHILESMGIDSSKKGVLQKTTISQEISTSTGQYLETLNNLNNSNYVKHP